MWDIIGILLERALMFVRMNWIALLATVAVLVVARMRGADRFRSTVSIPAPYLLVLLIASGITASLVAVRGIPLPYAHDDYSYLLAGELLASGHVRSPTPDLWPHFETFHQLMTPAYASKYPPGMGLVLAAPQVIGLPPIAGVWILTSITAMAMLWCLRGWTTPGWAFLGAASYAMHPTVVRWTQTYHGGTLAALGAALVVGATGRMRSEPHLSHGAWFGAGSVLLLWSRPYEGLVICSLAGLYALRRRTLKALAAGFAVTMGGVLLTLLHARAITGSFTDLPYTAYQRQYDPAPNFIWQDLKPMPSYRNAEMEHFHRRVVLPYVQRQRSVEGLLDAFDRKLHAMFLAALPAVPGEMASARLLPLLPILVLPWMKRRALLIGVLTFTAAQLVVVWWMQTHYLAPVVPLVALIWVLLLETLHRYQPLLTAAAIAGLAVIAIGSWRPIADRLTPGFEAHRRSIVRQISSEPGRHLVMVPPQIHNYVFNASDLDAAPVIWARSLDPQSNERLLAHYRDRTVWEVAPDRRSARRIRGGSS